jgi:hypothetical protein
MAGGDDYSAYHHREILFIQEAARQSGVIVPLLQAAYFAIVSMSDLKRVIWGNWMWAIIFIVPVFLWLISLFLVIQIFVPPKIGSEARELPTVYENIVNHKYCLLRLSQYFLLAGLFSMAINVFLYFVCIPLPPPD